MDIMKVDAGNIAGEHICCAISDKKGEIGVANKKAWLTERFEEGLVFKKVNARGKVFIEYIPAENAWYPIVAEGYMHIDCLWVSGKFKGQGYGGKLFDACVKDSKLAGKNGITVISSKKKMPFLSDPKFLAYKGFISADTVGVYELLYYPLKENAPLPQFKDTVKQGEIENKDLVLYYTNQCPFANKYAHIFKAMAEDRGIPMELIQLTSKEEAQNSPAIFTSYSLFLRGKFVTNEIYSEKKIEKLFADNF